MGSIEKYSGPQPLEMINSIDDLARISQSIAKSGMFKDLNSADQVAVKVMIARELGLGLTAIPHIHLVKGNITLGYQILIALVKRSGKYDMRIKTRDENVCEIAWFENGEHVGDSKFTMADAKRSGLMGNSNYQKNPVEMLVARATSSGFNSYAPECAGGGLYSLGELDDPTPAPAPSTVRKTVEQSAPVAPSETVIEAEVVESATPAVVTPAAEDNPSTGVDAGESETVADSTMTPVQRAREMIGSLTAGEKEAVYEACDQLGIKRTLGSIVERFGDAAYSRETLLPALAAAVSTPVGSAEAFDEFLEDDTAKNIAAAEKAQDEAAARIKNRDRMAAAGSYGE